MNEINKTFEMFKENACVPEMKDLIQGIQEMYNQKEALQQRIDKAIAYIKENYTNADGSIWHEAMQDIDKILKGEDSDED